MNAAYGYDTQKASCIITNRIYYLLELHHWSIKTLSDESNIPYETLKKLLSKKTENTSFHNIMKIALAFKCNLNDLVEPLTEKNVDSNYFDKVGDSFDICTSIPKCTTIPLLSPYDLYDNNKIKSNYVKDTLDSSTLPIDIKETIDFGLQISSFIYHPIYNERDVLLISRKRIPKIGETGIFLHKNQLYVRILSRTFNDILLKSVNGIGPDIKIHDFSEWSILGYVVGVQRL